MRGHVEAFLSRRLSFRTSLLPLIRSKSSWAIVGALNTGFSSKTRAEPSDCATLCRVHTCLVIFSPEDSDAPWVEEKFLVRSLGTCLFLSMQQNYWASMEPLGQWFGIPLYFSRPLKKPLLFLLGEARCSSLDIHWLHFVHFSGVIIDREVDQSSWVLQYLKAAKSWALNAGCSSLKAPR